MFTPWHLQTRIALFSDHFLVCCKFSDHANWSVVECVDFSQITLQ